MAKTSKNYDYGNMDALENRVRGDMYGLESMKWYGWGSAVGLALVIASVGIFIWMLHLADIIH